MKLINNVPKVLTRKHVADFKPGDVIMLDSAGSDYVLLRLADDKAVVLVGLDSDRAIAQPVTSFASYYRKVDTSLVINS